MITCDRHYLLHHAKYRGYSLEEIMPCVVHQDGDLWTIDETSPFYPHPRSGPIETPKPLAPQCLAGTELKKLLKLVGITATPNCSCNSRANLMDAQGCEWVKENVETVAGWMGEEAAKRGLPYSKIAGRALVNLAIRRAEKAHRVAVQSGVGGT